MSESRGHESRFWAIFSATTGELVSEPLTERALRMHALVILETQVGGGGLSQWYENPSGVEGPRTIAALNDIGAHGLSRSMADALKRMEEEIVKRDEVSLIVEFTDEQLALSRKISSDFDDLFEESLSADEGSFYQLVADWWERISTGR